MSIASRTRGVVLLLLLFCITACSNVKDDVKSPVETPEKPITLYYASYLLDSAQASKVYYDAISEFEKQNPDIKIVADFIQNANYTAGIKIRLLGGEKLDVFDTWSPSLFEEFRKLNQNSNVYLNITDTEFLSQFLPHSLAPVTIDGKVYGVPEVMHSDGLLYNRTLFEQLNVEVPETWDDFITLCELLKSKGIIPIAFDAEWATAQFFWGSIMSNNGADGDWTKRLENGEIPISNEIFIDAIQKNKEIIDRGFVPKDWQSLKHEQAKDLVGQGKAAMIVTGTWSIPSLLERNSDIDIDFMMVPGEKKTVPNINIGNYRVINAKTEYPEQARRFIAFMNSRYTQEKFAEGALAVPSIIDASFTSETAARIATIVTREDATLYWPHTVSTESLQVKIQELVLQYLIGESLEDTLSNIQFEIDSANFNAN